MSGGPSLGLSLGVQGVILKSGQHPPVWLARGAGPPGLWCTPALHHPLQVTLGTSEVPSGRAFPAPALPGPPRLCERAGATLL